MVSDQYLREARPGGGGGNLLAGRPKILGGGNENLYPPLTTAVTLLNFILLNSFQTSKTGRCQFPKFAKIVSISEPRPPSLLPPK